MAARPPYRTAPAKPERARRLVTLIDRRFTSAFWLFVLVASALGVIELPRSVRVSCRPHATSVSCVATSQVRGFGSAATRRETTVSCADEAWARAVGFSERFRIESLGRLEVRLRSQGGGRNRPSIKYVTARCDGGAVDLTPGHAGSIDSDELEALTGFERALRAGESATFEYHVGASGLFAFVVSAFLALCVLLGGGARTRVSIDRERDRLEVFSWPGFLSGAKRKAIELGLVRDVIVVSQKGYKNRMTYLPAVRLASGEVVWLGSEGFSSQKRGQKVVDRLRGRLNIAPTSSFDGNSPRGDDV